MEPLKRLVIPLTLTLVAMLSLSLGAPLVLSAKEPAPQEIDAVFADFDSSTSPGCALGVMRDGRLVYKRGYGMANLEYGIAITPRSVFRTGSVGKQFTAMVMALLAEEGVISLDDPLSEFFPEFPAWAGQITVRHLIHHTSGLRDYLDLASLAGLDDDAHYTDVFAIELLARQKNLNFAPGTRYLYSNSGYFLMSHIVKRTTGETLRKWADERIFAPLGMGETHYHDDHTQIVANRATGYAPTDDGYRISMTTLDMVGDGGVFTTVEDLALWDRNFSDNKLGKGGRALIEQVTTPGRLANGEPLDYAFGLRVRDYRGLPSVGHGGAFVGFRAETFRFPEQRLSVAVLCNRSDAEPAEKTRQLADLYLGELMTPVTAAGSESGESRPVGVPQTALARLAGFYWDGESGSAVEIRLEGEKLLIYPSDEKPLELVPQEDGRFVFRQVPHAVTLRFETATGGGKWLIVAYRDEEPTVLESFTKRTPTTAELESYTGTFYSDELDVRYVLEISDGRLAFGFGRPGSHPLEPQFGEIFTNPDYGAFEFEHSTEGAVTAFSLSSEGVRGLRFVRVAREHGH